MTNPIQIKVVIAEDEDLIRGSLVKKVKALDPSIHILGDAQDGKMALQLIEQQQPDLLLTDIRMPVMDGMELIKTLHLYHPRIRTIITSGYADFEYARQALQYGVQDYLLKPVSTAELKRVVMQAFQTIIGEKAEVQQQQRLAMNSESAGTEEIVALVQNYMRENFHRELSLEKIAKSFNFNASYLSKIFMKHVGEPPSKYLTSLRINEAKYLLTQHASLSIKEVGERVGYPDQFYFSRIFKQVTGQTPKEYQK